jgi:hypothetical protein
MVAAASCSKQQSGAVVEWGLGGSASRGSALPASIDGTAGTATAISVGETHACAIQAGTHAAVCWPVSDEPNYNAFGQATRGRLLGQESLWGVESAGQREWSRWQRREDHERHSPRLRHPVGNRRSGVLGQ